MQGLQDFRKPVKLNEHSAILKLQICQAKGMWAEGYTSLWLLISQGQRVTMQPTLVLFIWL
jgi:hypothetical protein